MLPKIVARRAAQIRDLLDRGALDGLRVPLPNGGTLPAAMFAEVALGDLDRLSALGPNDEGEVGGISWRRLGENIELLHEVVLATRRRRPPSATGTRVTAPHTPLRRTPRYHPDCASLLGPPARSTGL